MTDQSEPLIFNALLNIDFNLQEISQELSLTQEKHRIGVAELAKKEEQLVVLQVAFLLNCFLFTTSNDQVFLRNLWQIGFLFL